MERQSCVYWVLEGMRPTDYPSQRWKDCNPEGVDSKEFNWSDLAQGIVRQTPTFVYAPIKRQVILLPDS